MFSNIFYRGGRGEDGGPFPKPFSYLEPIVVFTLIFFSPNSISYLIFFIILFIMADEPNRYEPPRVTIPRPTSERDCASIVLTYVYVAASMVAHILNVHDNSYPYFFMFSFALFALDIIDETLEEQQRNYCRRTQRLVNDLPSHCACPVVNGRKCTGQATCVNRRRKVACAGNCGTECKNNP